MTSLFYFVRLAVHNLRRGGQRVIAALMCITFGVTVLVALTIIAKSIENNLLLEPAQLVGGDISMVRTEEDTIGPEHVGQLEALEQSGEISHYTLIAYNSSSIMIRPAGSGEMHFVGNGMGIEPDRYPLAGSLAIGEPVGGALPDLLRQVGDVVITRDIALEYNFSVGDRLTLADLRSGSPLEGIVRGIAYDTPNHQGDKVYYTIDTAQALANGQQVVNTVIANTDWAQAVSEKLESSGWSVDWVAGRRTQQTGNAWVIGLRGAGILGLLVGGIGIANTMQVLVRRRQREIAIWKTLGYQNAHLGLIFSLEAGLLGLAGSLLGALLGILISGQVLEIVRRMSNVLYQWTFSPAPPLMGIVVGTLATLIFAVWAIVVSGQARPMALLRNERINVEPLAGCLSALLGLLLALPFVALASLVMGSVIGGIGVLAAILVGMGMLGGFFSVLLWACTRVLPVRAFPLARMAFINLRRQGNALVFAMIALFAGVLSMSVGLAVEQFIERKASIPSANFESYNLTILARADQESAVRQTVQAHNPEQVSLGYRTALNSLSNNGSLVSGMDAVLIGRSDPADYILDGVEWGSQPDGVYVYQGSGVQAGSQVEVTFRGGETKTFAVVGTYDINFGSIHLYPPTGLLISAEGFIRAARPDSLTCFVQVAPSQLDHAAADLGAALPQATVVNLEAYTSRFMHSYQKLFILPVVLAGLALLAGFLLIANSTSLEVLERRYEIGVLKTVGYSRRQVLSIFGVEYGFVSLLATGSAVFLIQSIMAVIGAANRMAISLLLLGLQPLALIAFCGIGLTLMVVFGVAWAPSRVSPVDVLNERN